MAYYYIEQKYEQAKCYKSIRISLQRSEIVISQLAFLRFITRRAARV